ncbi:MAG: Radical SAM domain protein [Thermotogales bacterium 46_20]|nr:MAG: Radical SAM domain protein [Thermotogales bacterium 46_20]
MHSGMKDLKRILLVNPWIEDVAAYDYWLKPIGLLYISAILRNAGIETHLVDCLDRHDPELANHTGHLFVDRYYGTGKFYSEVISKPECMKWIPRRFKRYGFPPELLRKKLRKLPEIDAVFVTSIMTYWHYGVSDCISVIRDEIQGVPIVLGGIYASLIPDHAQRYSGADAVFPGMGITPIKRALQYLGMNRKIEENWFRFLKPDYDHYERLSHAVVITSTGCPFRCSYCAGWSLWGSFNQCDVTHTVDIIKELVEERNVKDIAFFDDALLINPGFKDLLDMLAREDLDARFHLPNGVHTRLLDEQTARLFKQCNFKTINLALETVNEDVMRKTGDKVSSTDFSRAVKLLNSQGFGPKEISAYIIANLPGQSFQDVKRAIEFCEDSGVVPKINELTPIPGTELWKELTACGSIPEDIDPLMLNNSLLPYWWEDGLSLEELQELKSIANVIKEQLTNV